MVALDMVFWYVALTLMAWVNSHSYFDRTGNENGIDYDTIITVLVGLCGIGYFIVLLLRG